MFSRPFHQQSVSPVRSTQVVVTPDRKPTTASPNGRVLLPSVLNRRAEFVQIPGSAAQYREAAWDQIATEHLPTPVLGLKNYLNRGTSPTWRCECSQVDLCVGFSLLFSNSCFNINANPDAGYKVKSCSSDVDENSFDYSFLFWFGEFYSMDSWLFSSVTTQLVYSFAISWGLYVCLLD